MSSRWRSAASAPLLPAWPGNVAIAASAAQPGSCPEMSQPTFRFAPSPNGELHLGHAYSALLNQQLARQADGRLLLRIEDIDSARCTPEYGQGAVGDLAWLGIDWEEPVRRQSEHFADYPRRSAADPRGLVYPAFMSRGEIRSLHRRGGSRRPALAARPGRRAALSRGRPDAESERERRRRMATRHAFAWRLDCQAAMAGLAGPLSFDRGRGRDAVGVAPGRRRSGTPGATSCSPARTCRRAITSPSSSTTRCRGSAMSCAAGICLPPPPCSGSCRCMLGLPEPRYFHHRLIVGPDGRKLSKSNRDTGIAALRAAGLTPADVRAKLPL